MTATDDGDEETSGSERRFLPYAVGHLAALVTLAAVVRWTLLSDYPVYGRGFSLGIQSYAVVELGDVAAVAAQYLELLPVAVVAGLGIVLAFVALSWYRATGERETGPDPPFTIRQAGDAIAWTPVAVGVGLVFAALFTGGLTMVDASPSEDYRYYSPQVAVEYEYEPSGNDTGVVTVTHGFGDAIGEGDEPPAAVVVRGDGFANVSGAALTGPGVWRRVGESTGRTIDVGESVTVGVESDCRIRIVYDATLARDWEQTLGVYRCPDIDR